MIGRSLQKSINPDVTYESQTNAIFGVAFVLLSGTRAACFPRNDAGATDVYRFPRGRARTCGLENKVEKLIEFSALKIDQRVSLLLVLLSQKF